ncbi:MAG: hypothetical protein HUU01_12270 [Saprospiraceae bacterium]|nr:hypothetical protein [Saprospiraceae bacterium]
MITSNKYSQIALLFSLLIPLLLHSCRKENPEIPDNSFVAFSLREAQQILQSPHPEKDSALQQLGGITRVVGTVIDRENQDIILIGKKSSQLPTARFDDLLIALRSRFVHNDLPMVSIDAPSDPNYPEQQEVRFGGKIENTPFGNDFLQADILLKKYSLEIERQIQQVDSYRKLLLNHEIGQLQKQGITVTNTRIIDPEELTTFQGKSLASEGSIQSRFWFNYRDPYKVRTDGTVFCILSLDLVVIKETKNSTRQATKTVNSMGPDDQFSQLFSNNYYALCKHFPVLQRLKLLFDLVALAEGLKGIRDLPQIDYLLHDCPVQKLETPKTYNLIKRCTALRRSDGKTSLVQLSGGIEPSVELEFLNAGNISYLQKFVLNSRPHANALSWQVPISLWDMPNAEGMSEVAAKNTAQKDKSSSGFSINVSQSVVFDRLAVNVSSIGTFQGFPVSKPLEPFKTGGVRMHMVVDSIASFHLVDSLIRVKGRILSDHD